MKLGRIVQGTALASGPLLAALTWLGSAHPDLVERVYSRGIYPKIAAVMARLFPQLPVPCAEVLALLALAWILFVGGRGVGRLIWPSPLFPRWDWPKRLGRWARRAVTVFSCVLALFLALWGLNYQRLSWAENNGWKVEGGSVGELANLVDGLVDAAVTERAKLKDTSRGTAQTLGGEGWNSNVLRQEVSRAYQKVSLTYPLLKLDAPPAKTLWFPDFFSSLGIGGIFIPFTGEPLVNPGPGGPSLAFDAAHEMSHERGWAREDEANFLAFLVLSQSGKADLEYAADLMALMYAAPALERSGPAGLSALKSSLKRLSPKVVRDWNAYILYWRRFAGPVQKAAQTVNDSYLKTQGQKDGIRSYGRMVDLLLTYEKLARRKNGVQPSVLAPPKRP